MAPAKLASGHKGITRRKFGRLLGAGAALSSAVRLPAMSAPPRLTVWIVVEQLRPDYLNEVSDQLVGGGLRRLIENGAWFPDCRHAASTFTSTGLATLATGAWPSMHGIIADSWYDKAARRAVRASDEALLANTLAAQVAASPRSRVVVAGMDAANVRLFAGTAAARLYWMDENGQFAARGQTPDWLVAYNRQKPLENLHDAKWMVLAARTGAPPLRTLAYNPARPSDFVALYKASPFAQMAQFELLHELLVRERLGQEDTTDLACLLLGSTALLGYDTGAASPLMLQMVLHFDRHLEFLFGELDRTLGPDAFNVVVTAVHGAPPAPPPESRARMAVNGEQLAQAIQRTLGSGGPRVEKYVYPFLYLDPGPGRDPEAVRLAAARAAMSIPAVASYYTAGGASPVAGAWAERFRNSFHAPRSGDVMLSYRPEFVEDYGAGRGISYGSLYNYDAVVPVCFYGPQFRAGTFVRTVGSVDVAPTLALALGAPLPASAVGNALGDALVENVKSKK
jgi:type I phosphodiesterase/nucleotide pyrophosphatase